MNRKFIFVELLFLLIFLSGCSVNYNLNFRDNELEENIDVILSSSENTEQNIEKLNYSAENEAYAISKQKNQELYNFSSKKNGNNFIGSFNYNYTIEDFNDAHLIRECYDSFNFVKTDNNYQLTTSDIFTCGSYSYLPVEKYTITLKTNHRVISSNADYEEDNKYVWIIVPNGNVEIEKPIRIVFSSETRKDELIDNLDKNSNTVAIIIVCTLSCVIILLGLIFIIKNKRNNS